jgi:hypothetical protein
LRAQFRWEKINAVLYKIGGIVFIVGRILIFPSLTLTRTSGRGPFLLARYSTLSSPDMI